MFTTIAATAVVLAVFTIAALVLAYSKGKQFTFNRQFGPYSDSYIKSHYNLRDPDGRIYQLGDLTAPELRTGTQSDYEWKGHRPPPGGHWRYSRDNMERLDKQGRIVYTRTGRPRLKRYLDEMPGVSLGDVWTDIPPVNSQALQRLGYPTQKPVPLMERIIKASSREDDIVLDAFCGCGTTLEAAAKLRRRWIGVDVSPTACPGDGPAARSSRSSRGTRLSDSRYAEG